MKLSNNKILITGGATGLGLGLTERFIEENNTIIICGRREASLLFVTPKHPTKAVKETTTKTCGELIDEMIINEAKILLDSLSMSVVNAAEALRFGDQFHFSKFFKSHTGINPSYYKKNF